MRKRISKHLIHDEYKKSVSTFGKSITSTEFHRVYLKLSHWLSFNTFGVAREEMNSCTESKDSWFLPFQNTQIMWCYPSVNNYAAAIL